MTERDIVRQPYTTDERRVCEFLQRLAPDIGCGDDPIGFLMTSYETVVGELNLLNKSDKAKLWDALEFYAAAESYHAIAFLVDRPSGGFADDFSADHGDDFYDRPMPGAKARAALRECRERA